MAAHDYQVGPAFIGVIENTLCRPATNHDSLDIRTEAEPVHGLLKVSERGILRLAVHPFHAVSAKIRDSGGTGWFYYHQEIDLVNVVG